LVNIQEALNSNITQAFKRAVGIIFSCQTFTRQTLAKFSQKENKI